MRARAGAALVAMLVAGLPLASCGFDGAQSLPLPGAPGGDGYTVTITFEDAANLVPKETCRANDTVVGSVVSVELEEVLSLADRILVMFAGRIPVAVEDLSDPDDV